MELGGNGQLRAWFKKCHTENSALEMKYRTKAATLYRDNLRAAADDDLASGAAGGEGGGGGGGVTARSPERAPVSGKGKGKGRIFVAAERAAADNLAREVRAAWIFVCFCSCMRDCLSNQQNAEGRLCSRSGEELSSVEC